MVRSARPFCASVIACRHVLLHEVLPVFWAAGDYPVLTAARADALQVFTPQPLLSDRSRYSGRAESPACHGWSTTSHWRSSSRT